MDAHFAIDLGLKISALLVAACLALLILRRASAATRHLVAAAGLLGALAVPALALVLPRWELPILPPAARASTQVVAAPAAGAYSVVADNHSYPMKYVVAPAAPVVNRAVPGGARLWRQRLGGFGRALLLGWVALTWAAIAGLILLRLLVGVARVRARTRRAVAPDFDGWSRPLVAALSHLGLSRFPRLALSDEIEVPMTAGALKPVVLLPAGANAWPEERRRLVLLHELAHVQRNDWLVHLGCEAAAGLLWFNPLAHVLQFSLRRDAEKAADDLVIASGELPSTYAAHLLQIRRALQGAGEPAFAMAMARPSGFEDRMRSLLERRPRGPSSRAGRAAAALIVVFALALSTARPTAANPTTLKSIASVLHPRASWYERGKALHDQGRYEDAIEAFSRAIEAGQREGAATYNIACGLARLGHKDLAFDWLHKAEAAGFDVGEYLERDDDLDSLRADPRFAALVREHGRDGSRKAFAFKLDKPESDDQDRGQSVERRFEKMAARSGEPWYQIGKELLNAHSYAHAAEAFAQAAARLEKKGSALYNRACALAHLGEQREALDELRRAVEAGFTDARHIKSDDDLTSLRGDRRFDDAVALAEELALPPLKSGGDQSEREAAKWREAAERFEELARRSGKLGLAFYNAGFARLAAGDLDKASTDFTRSLDLAYRRSASLYNLGCVEARRGDKDRAFRYLERSLEAGFAAQQMQSDRDLESLRDDPRFDALVRRAENKVSANN